MHTSFAGFLMHTNICLKFMCIFDAHEKIPKIRVHFEMHTSFVNKLFTIKCTRILAIIRVHKCTRVDPFSLKYILIFCLKISRYGFYAWNFQELRFAVFKHSEESETEKPKNNKQNIKPNNKGRR